MLRIRPTGPNPMCCSLRSLCESHSGQLPAECQNFTVHQPPAHLCGLFGAGWRIFPGG